MSVVPGRHRRAPRVHRPLRAWSSATGTSSSATRWWEIAFFFWTAANTLTIVFIAKGVVADGGSVDIDRLTTILLIGAVMWSYLGIIFELLIETVAWERWEGTIEYTFMAPLTPCDAPARHRHLRHRLRHRSGVGRLRRDRRFLRAAHAERELRRPAFVLIAIASVSFVGIGMMTAVLPLISPEKGTQFGYVAQGLMLVVSRRLLPGLGAARLHAVAVEVLAGDVRAPRRAVGDPRRCERRCRLGRHLADGDHRRHLGAARHLGLPPGELTRRNTAS